MRQIRIITDDSVQFIRPIYQDTDIHLTIPFDISIYNSNPHPLKQPCLEDFPKSLIPDYSIKIVPPDMDVFLSTIQPRTLISDDFLVLTSSSYLPSIYNSAIHTVESLHGQSYIHVLDTLTIHAGLLYLVQGATRLIKKKADISTIESYIRGQIPNIYTLLCIPNLSYLASLGIIDPAQAVVGEMMELLPVFSMEEGHLKILDKFLNFNQVIDYFINYISEFTALKHVTIIYDQKLIRSEINQFSEYLRNRCPRTEITKYPPSIPLTAMFGPEVFGMIAVEDN